MTHRKNKQKFQKNKRHGHSRGRGAGSSDNERLFFKKGKRSISDDDILGFIIGNDGKADSTEILNALDLGRNDRKILHLLLEELCERHILAPSGSIYTVKNMADYHIGTLSVNPRGFAFATIEIPPGQPPVDDIFVGARSLKSARHGDRVLLKLITRGGKRPEGHIIKIMARGISQMVGIFTAGKPFALVQPEDSRFAFSVQVPASASLGAKSGEAVVVKLDRQSESSGIEAGYPKGQIIEVLGDPDSLKVQTEMVIRKFELSHIFDPAVERQLDGISHDIKVDEGRLDLRDTLHITIDGETARDFDDAVSVQKIDSGFRLYVSIADVSHYVQVGTPLDNEAYRRGTSVYFPTRVLPMLPEALSNDLCSLVPNQARYTFTAIIEFDENGRLLHKKFAKSVIKSRHRMTYDLVAQIITDQDAGVMAQYPDLLAPLKWMEKLARLLLRQRQKRGSIGFELPEVYIEVGDDDQVLGIRRRQRNFAHQIIEEFMLAANEAVAQTISEQKLKDGLYRIHETPDPLKVGDFSTFAQSMGLVLPEDSGTPAWFGKILAMVKGSPKEYIINNLLLRTMKQARYSPHNVGHFGLAASHYTHFTSPIRRYPDLMVHRALAAFLTRKSGKAPAPPEEAGEYLSLRERVAVDAEREMIDRMKVRYMADKVGEEFDALISGVSSFGLFVELLESFISGGVAIQDLADDYYELDEKNHRLIGQRRNKVYQIGTEVRVRLESVDKARRRLNFVII
ncbi:MAG: ribonuclease R [Deltaproteobacteria bacterium]|nr:ribonuclease R [Deltaproteobacteria bacterium]